jgi:heme/copper-type cytochrome/quinol oxidase subunit 2
MRVTVVAFAICALGCAVAQVAILASLIRKQSAVANADVPRPRMSLELVWALIPALALAFLLTATWERVRDNAQKPQEVMKVAR